VWLRSPALRLVALVLSAAPVGGCSPLLYALLSLRGSRDSGTELVAGQSVQGSTDDEASSVTLSCGSPEGAGDESWTFVPPTSGPFRFTVHGQYDCALGLFGPDDPRRELACNDDSGSNNVSVVVANLEAGRRYVVVVDGYRGNEGSYQLTAENAGPGAVATPSPVSPPGTGPTLPTVVPESTAAMQARCDAAPILGAGVTSGNLDPTIATARTTCGSGPGGDVVYRLAVPSASHVTLKLEAVFDGILELRADCSGGRVLGCNDDSGDAMHSQVAAYLSAGTYFVIVDSYDPRNAGPFHLQVILRQ
jgi:hypothetical protein